MTAKELLKAIRDKCSDCCCGSRKAIKECSIKECSLWSYRCSTNEEQTENEYQISMIDLVDSKLNGRADVS